MNYISGWWWNKIPQGILREIPVGSCLCTPAVWGWEVIRFIRWRSMVLQCTNLFSSCALRFLGRFVSSLCGFPQLCATNHRGRRGALPGSAVQPGASKKYHRMLDAAYHSSSRFPENRFIRRLRAERVPEMTATCRFILEILLVLPPSIHALVRSTESLWQFSTIFWRKPLEKFSESYPDISCQQASSSWSPFNSTCAVPEMKQATVRPTAGNCRHIRAGVHSLSYINWSHRYSQSVPNPPYSDSYSIRHSAIGNYRSCDPPRFCAIKSWRPHT